MSFIHTFRVNGDFLELHLVSYLGRGATFSGIKFGVHIFRVRVTSSGITFKLHILRVRRDVLRNCMRIHIFRVKRDVLWNCIQLIRDKY